MLYRYAAFEAWSGQQQHHRAAAYEELKDRIAQQLLRVLWEKRPDLKEKMVWCEVGTRHPCAKRARKPLA